MLQEFRGLTIGFVPYDGGMSSKKIKNSLKQKGKIEILFLIEGDDFELDNDELKNTFVIYIGHHGDKIKLKSRYYLTNYSIYRKKCFNMLIWKEDHNLQSKLYQMLGKICG